MAEAAVVVKGAVEEGGKAIVVRGRAAEVRVEDARRRQAEVVAMVVKTWVKVTKEMAEVVAKRAAAWI